MDWPRYEYRHFTPGEAWGVADKMAPWLIRYLDDFRDYIGRPVVINRGYDLEAAPNSYHRTGEAVDVGVDGYNMLDLFLAASRFPFTGIGVYPLWMPRPGLHLDVRSGPGILPRAFWLCLAPKQYIPLNTENIKLFLL